MCKWIPVNTKKKNKEMKLKSVWLLRQYSDPKHTSKRPIELLEETHEEAFTSVLAHGPPVPDLHIIKKYVGMQPKTA